MKRNNYPVIDIHNSLIYQQIDSKELKEKEWEKIKQWARVQSVSIPYNATILQCAFGLGYNRAKRFLERLVEDGIALRKLDSASYITKPIVTISAGETFK